MSNFKTLLIIPFMVLQMTGVLSGISWDNIQLAQFAGNICKEIKCEVSSGISESSKDLQIKKEADFKELNTPICPKEISLKCEETPALIKTQDDRSVKVNPQGAQPQIHKKSEKNPIQFGETVKAQLF